MDVFNKYLIFKNGVFLLILCFVISNAKEVNNITQYKRVDSSITTIDIINDKMVGHAIPYIYDVKVDNTKLVHGTAVGYYKDVEKLMRYAVNDAKNKLTKPADILTRAEYEYHQKDTILTVNVVGYPGYYVNYRPITDINNDGFIDSSIYWRVRSQSKEKRDSDYTVTEDIVTRFDYLMTQYGNPHSREIERFRLGGDTAKYFTVGYVANFPYSYAGISLGLGYSIKRFYLNFDLEFGYGGHILKDGDEYHYPSEYIKTTRHDFVFGINASAYGCVFETGGFALLIGGRVGYTGLSSKVKYAVQNRQYLNEYYGFTGPDPIKLKGNAIIGPSVRFDFKINEKTYFSPSYSFLLGKNIMQHIFLGFSVKI